jgi:hypothetical protein
MPDLMRYRKIDAHACVGLSPDDVEQQLDIADEQDMDRLRKASVLFDTSGREIKDLRELMAQFGEGRFMFGTHSSMPGYVTGLLRIEAVRDSETNSDTKELLRSGNVRTILDL